MDISNNKKFKIFDKKGEYLGDAVIETVLTDAFDPEYIDAYIVRFDNGDVKCLDCGKYKLNEITE